MTTSRGAETSHDIPDKFFVNELKRGVLAESQRDYQADLQQASDYIDVLALEQFFRDLQDRPEEEQIRAAAQPGVYADQFLAYYNVAYEDISSRSKASSSDFRGQVTSLTLAAARTARIIDAIKTQSIGEQSSTLLENSVVSRFFERLSSGIVKQVPHRPGAHEAIFMTKLANEAHTKTSLERGYKSWLWGKAFVFSETLMETFTTRDMLLQMPDISDADAEMIERSNMALAEASKTLKTYTPKPAIGKLTEAVQVDSDIQTVVIDPEASVGFLTSVDDQNGKPVVFRLFSGIELVSSNVAVDERIAYQHDGGHVRRLKVEGVNTNTATTAVVFDDMVTFRGTPIKAIGEFLGLSNQATVLSALLFAQRYDLTVPSYLVDLANEDAAQEPAHLDANPISDKLRRLLLARTRVLQTLGTDIDKELASENEDDLQTHRDIAKHGVVGHLRRLPAGYSASTTAQALCRKQLGVDIPEGHTYVQVHTRGSLDIPSKGHKIIQNTKSLGKIGLSAR